MSSDAFVGRSPLRLMVAGYINLNVIDGSAFFLAGVTAMCSRYPGVEVTLVAATPLGNLEVVAEVMGLPNVTVIDPWRHPVGAELGLRGGWMRREQYGQVLAALDARDPFDAVLVRDNDAALHFLEARPEAVDRTTVYLTGVRHVGEGLEATVAGQLDALHRLGVRSCVQTPVMREALAASGFVRLAEAATVLPPHVPDSDGSFDEVHLSRPQPTRLVYTGKFVADWIPDRILAGVKAAASVVPELHLDVAGDQFRDDPHDPLFVDNVKYLLESSPAITWHGRLPRQEARDLIRSADIGISWRSAALDSSTELSTKLLEYGALGKPVIVNRTVMHESLLGCDYGSYANSSSDFRRLLLELPTSVQRLREDAERCYEAARPHWYSSVAPGFLDSVGCRPSSERGVVSVEYERLRQGMALPDGTAPLVRPVLRGRFLDLVPDVCGVPADQALARASMMRDWQEAAARARQPVRAVVVSVPAPTDEVSSKELDTARKEVALLTRKLDATREQRDAARRQLDNLRRSKLGRAQRAVWKARSMMRPSGGEG